MKISDIINLDSEEDNDEIRPRLATFTATRMPTTVAPSRQTIIESSTSPFRRAKDGTNYQISKNIMAKRFREFTELPLLVSCDPDGFASFIICKNDEQVSTIKGTVFPYSLHLLSSKDSTIVFNSDTYPCTRITKKCSGIKHCSTSKGLCSVPHYGDDVQQFQNVAYNPQDHRIPISDQMELARQVFFCPVKFPPRMHA